MKNKKPQSAEDFWKKYYAQLEGRRIVAAGYTGGQPWFDLDDGTKVEVWADPEGNGDGYLFGLNADKARQG